MTSLTRIDFSFSIRTGRDAGEVSFVGINPAMEPGSVSLVAARAPVPSLGSQVACKLASDHFLEGVLNYFAHYKDQDFDLGLHALQSAMKNANDSVYAFGHKLNAGGRLAAEVIGGVLHEERITMGRIGDCVAYLIRNKDVFPFFEKGMSSGEDQLLGSRSKVSVELASVELQPLDDILIAADSFPEAMNEALVESLARLSAGEERKSDILAQSLGLKMDYLALIRIGPETHFLR